MYIISIVLLVGLIVLEVYLRNSGSDWQPYGVINSLTAFFAATCGAMALREKFPFSARPFRKPLIFLSSGAFLWSLGQMWWLLQKSLTGRTPSLPGIPDIAFVAAYSCVVLGLIAFLRTKNLRNRAQILLDSAFLAGSLGTLTWYFLVQKMWSAGAPWIERATRVFYPLVDIVIVFLIFSIYSSHGKAQRRPAFSALAAGLLTLTLADSAFGYYVAHQNMDLARWTYPLWALAWTLIGLGLLNPLRVVPSPQQPPSPPESSDVGLGRAMLPNFFLMICLGAIVINDAQDGSIGNTVFVLMLILFFLVLLRQALFAMENRALNAELRIANSDLEGKIECRVAEISIKNKLLLDEIKERNRSEEKLRILSEASAVLGTDLRTEECLSKVLSLIVPSIADCCSLEVHTKGGLKEVAVPRNYDSSICLSAHRIDLQLPHNRATFSVFSESANVFGENERAFFAEFAERIRTAVENRQLYEDSQQSLRAKTAFLANISHEIRTPLGAMLGFIELLEDPSTSPTTRSSYVEVVRRNAAQLSHLIDDLLDLSKIDAGGFTIEMLDFDLYEMLQDLGILFQHRAHEKGIYFIWSIADDVPCRICCDPTRLKQILMNVIGNAFKFTEHGEVSLNVSSSDTQSLRFEVRDTGPGISEGALTTLFHPFEQADPSMTRRFGGTGLGLALSRGLARALGGDLRLLETHLNQGSAFVAEIAFEPAQENLMFPTQLSQEARESALHPQTLQNVDVLVVDDSADNRTLLKLILESAGAHVETANDGEEGIQKAMSGSFDVVLMDIQMPKLTGWQAASYLRDHNFKAPLLALTAHAMPQEQRKSLEAGFNGHLAKPITRRMLLGALHSLNLA